MRPIHWHVAMIYRNGECLIPTGDRKLKLGDRVLLAGEPKVLENIANLLLTGTPQFPLQYGERLVYPLEKKKQSCSLEAAFWLQKTNVKQIEYLPYHRDFSQDELIVMNQFSEDFCFGEGVGLFRDILDRSDDFGLLFLELNRFGRKYRIRTCFRYAKCPFLISRNQGPYEKIVVSLNCHQPIIALETGVEIARLSGLPLEVCFVALPKEMRQERENEEIIERKGVVSDFKTIFKMDFPYHLFEGNPVKQTLKYLANNKTSLLITVANSKDSTSFFNTNVPFLLAARSWNSTLVLPGDQGVG